MSESSLVIEYVATAKLRPFSGNPRKIEPDEMEKLKRSLDEFGFVDPVIARKTDGMVIGGHQRLEAAKELEWDKVPVVYIDITDDKASLLNIALNKISGEFDWPKLGDLFAELDTGDIDLTYSGFDLDEIANLMTGLDEASGNTDADAVPEVPEEAKTQLGDLWLLGDHRLLCGDSTKKEDVERLMDGEKAGLLFTSPPYSDMREYNGDKDLSISNLIKFIPTFAIFAEYQVINLGMQRKNNEVVQYWDDYIKTAKEAGYKFLSWNVWSREGMGGSIANMCSMFRCEHEWLFVFGINRKPLNNTKKNKSAGLHTGVSNRQKDGTTKKAKPKIVNEYGRLSSVSTLCYGNSQDHPAVFPVELPEEYIKAMTKMDDITIDPFLGSGSTLIACEKTNRKCYGMELDPHYCDVIVKRWEDYTGEKATRSAS